MGHCKRLMALISFIATGGAQWAQIGGKMFKELHEFFGKNWDALLILVTSKECIIICIAVCFFELDFFLSYFIPLCGAFRMYIEHTILSQTKLQRHLNGFMWYIIKNSLLNEQSKWNEYFFCQMSIYFLCYQHICVWLLAPPVSKLK